MCLSSVQEFHRLRSSLRAKREHASLLDFRDFDRSQFDLEVGPDSDHAALLKEQAAIGRSSGQVLSFCFLVFPFGSETNAPQVHS
jgi:hypothetical protein